MSDSEQSSVGTSAIQMVDEDESPINSSINTTPLVDVMLVLLIIFLITIPVAIGNIDVTLPEERNVVVIPKVENVNLSVSSDGSIYWNLTQVSEAQLASRLAVEARVVPQPEVHIRGDLMTEYWHVGRVVELCQRSGIMKIGFITKAPPRGLVEQ